MSLSLQLAAELTAERVRAAEEVAGAVARMEREAAVTAVARERRVRHAAEDAAAAARSLAAAAIRADAEVVRPALLQAERRIADLGVQARANAEKAAADIAVS